MIDLKKERDRLTDLEILFNEKRYAEALSFAEEISKEFPSSFQMKLLHAKILKELNKLDEAENLLKEEVSNFPDNVNLLLEVGDIYSKKGEYNLATEYYNKVMFIDPFNLKAKKLIEKTDEIRKKKALKTEFSADSITYKEKENKNLDDTNISEPEREVEDNPVIEVEETVEQKELEEDILKFEENKEELQEIVYEDIKINQEENNQISDFKIDEEILEKKMDDTIDEISFGEEFITESAAKLYIDQGLYNNAIVIYEKLLKKSKEEKYSERIIEIKRSQKIIQKLEHFSKLIQNIGEKVV